MVVALSYIFKYSGFEVTKPLVERPSLKINVECSKEYFEKFFGGEYSFLFILNHFNVKLYSSERTPPFAMKEYIAEIGTFEGFTRFIPSGTSFSFDLKIPLNKELLDEIEKIRLKECIPTFRILCNYSAFPLGYMAPEKRISNVDGFVMKYTPDGELRDYIAFTTEEIDDLLEKIEYVDVIRIEFRVPKAPTPSNEWLIKSLDALKNARDYLTGGHWGECLNVCRNIIMNILIPPLSPEKKERKLRDEVVKAILNKAPEKMREEYKLILKGIETTLRENLKHIHKFIRKETGEFLAYPSMKEAIFVFTMIANIVRYFCDLTT
jgi:hypothetical protein